MHDIVAGTVMEVGFASLDMAKTCSSPAQTRRRWGREVALKIQLRLDQMLAASTLAELVSLPQVSCARLAAGDGAQFVLDLHGGQQMIVAAAEGPASLLDGGKLDLEKVDRLVVVGITECY